jgi:16S rRNA processing protein RimM
MIKETDVFPIGHFYKTHGTSGELAFSFTTDVFDRTASPYWVIDMDGILVPFFIQSCRIRSGSSALVRLEGIDDESQARTLVGKEVSYPVAFADDKEPEPDDWNALTGFKVTDEARGPLGEVIAIDDSTINLLLVVSNGKKEVLIPVAGDYITGIDAEERILWVFLPGELLDL